LGSHNIKGVDVKTKNLFLLLSLTFIFVLVSCKPNPGNYNIGRNQTDAFTQGIRPSGGSTTYNGTPTRPGGETPYPSTTPDYTSTPPTNQSYPPGNTPTDTNPGYNGAPTPPVTSGTATITNKFVASSPVSVFTAQDIEKLGVKVMGTPREMADAIRKWQESNMVYGSPNTDFSDAIRWNYFLPGIFSSRNIVTEHLSNSKPYGICFDFAVVYSSIANYYGLETRIRNSISVPSQTDKTIQFTSGMAPDEYDRLAVKLQNQGLDYDYDAIRLVASETPSHYWAEVKIDGAWVIEDATQVSTGNNTQTLFIDKNDVQLTDWMSRDKLAVLNDYQTKIDSGQRLPEP